MSLTIEQVTTKADYKAFINVPYDLYRGEPHWRPQLRMERKAHGSEKSNSALKDYDVARFLAKRNGKVVGRIAAFLNRIHLNHYADATGHFGFLDCETNPETGKALLAKAEAWLQAKNMRRMVGPMQWSVNDECGLLIDGFDTPPVLMMPYGRPDYLAIYEGAGLQKAVDMYAYMSDMYEGYPRTGPIKVLNEVAQRHKHITIRPMRADKFLDEVRLVMDIFNDAWSENWGFIPFDDDEIVHMAKEIKPLLVKEFFWVAEIRGKPAAFVWMIPDLYSAIHDLDGKLFPIGWMKLLYRLKVRGVTKARIPLMGLRKEFHGKRVGTAAVVGVCEAAYEEGRKKGLTHCELSWVLEDNQSMKSICEQSGAVAYKTYRIFEKNI